MKNNELSYSQIEAIIRSFYDKAKIDVMIGYHFRVIQNFDEHIPRIADFWHLQLTGKITNKDHLPFQLLEVHKPLGIKKGEVGRWMVLFEQNLKEYIDRNIITNNQADNFLVKVKHFETKIRDFFFKN